MAERLFVGTRGGLAVLERRDGGFRETRRIFPELPIAAVAADAGRRLVFAGTPSGVSRSADGGETFSPVAPLAGREARYIHIDRDSHRVYVGTHPDVALHVSSDGGERWDSIELRSRIPEAIHGKWLFHPFPRYGAHVKSIASSCGRIYLNVEEGWCYRSDDEGASWRPLLQHGLNVDAHVLAVDPRDRQVVYSTDAFGACRSRDGGETWIRIPPAEPGPRRYGGGIAVHPRKPSVVLFSLGLARVFALGLQGARSALLRSEDAGETWQRIGPGLPDPCDARIETLVFDTAPAPAAYALTDLGDVLEGREDASVWERVARVAGGHASHYALGVF